MADPSKELALEQQQAGAFDDVILTGSMQLPETPKEKLFRKLKQEPLVPIGSLLTCAALIVASNHLRKGNRNQFQKALRWRVGFQGLTILGAVAGSFYYNQKVSSPPSPSPPSPSSSASNVAGGAAGGGQTKPTNLWQQMRSDEREAKNKAEFEKRLAQAKGREEEDVEKQLEEALLGKEERPKRQV
ncbi:Respiratory supercomplex factor 1, mitochondrial [Thecaphora frezii]